MAKKSNQANNPLNILADADEKNRLLAERCAKMVDALYQKAVADLSALANMVKPDENGDFSFDSNPAAGKKAEQVILGLSNRIAAIIGEGDRRAWIGACEKSDKFISAILNTSKLPKDRLDKYRDRNLESLAAFQERKVNGLGLSERVWTHVSKLKDEVELVAGTLPKKDAINTDASLQKIENAIGTGMSAAELSREVRSCLKEPNKLFRRVRDKNGNLQLSKAAKLYHPGQGVYRSSYKNAMRVTRSEINMAYRQSDHMRWQQMDFVVGIEINLSNNHTIKDPKTGQRVPFHDICDELAGKYPKEFKFVGWHPQCKCFATPILKSLEELDAEIDKGGNYMQLPSASEVTDVPQGFKEYIQDNDDRIKGWSSVPYYIKDNQQFYDKALHPGKYAVHSLVLDADTVKQLSVFEMYGFNHQGSKKFNDALAAAKVAQLKGDLQAFEEAMSTMEFTKKTNDRIAALNARKKEAAKNKMSEEELRKQRIQQAAEKRHAARTPEKIQQLQEYAKKHKEESDALKLDIKHTIKASEGIQDVDKMVGALKELRESKYATAEKLKAAAAAIQAKVDEFNAEMDKAKALVNELDGISDVDTKSVLKARSIQEVKDEAKKLQDVKDKIAKLTTLDNPLQVAKDYSLADAVATHNSVVKNVTSWENKYSKDAYLQSAYTKEEYLAKKLDFEAYSYLEGNMNDVQNKFKTWKVAQKAYIKKLEDTKEIIWKKDCFVFLNTLNQEMIAMNAPKSGAIMKAWKKAQNAVLAGDHVSYEQAIIEYNDQRAKLIEKQQKKSKSIIKEDVVFKERDLTSARKNNAKQFHTDEESQAYFFGNAQEHYSVADNDTKQAAENYSLHSGYLTKSARGISGYYEKERSYAEKAAKDMQKLTDFIRRSSFEHDVWISREERVAFLTLKTGGMDADRLMDNVEEYEKKARIKYKGKRTAKEIDSLVERYKKHEEKQLVGRTGVDPSILSTSANLDQRFCGTGGDNRYDEPKVHLEIFCPKGTQAVYADPYSHYTKRYVKLGPDGFWDAKSKPSKTSENEIFLQQHTEFKILEARYNKAEDKWYVKAAVIAQRPRDVKGIVYDDKEHGYKIEYAK